MQAISLTGGPKRPSMALAVCLLIAVLFLLGGCETKQYRSVPYCDIVSPPQASRYIDANPDEQTVLMTDAYIAQVKVTAECNDRIKLVNAANKAE